MKSLWARVQAQAQTETWHWPVPTPSRLDLTEPWPESDTQTWPRLRLVFFLFKVLCLLWKKFLTDIQFLMLASSGPWLCFLSLCFLVGILYLLATHDSKRQSKIIQPEPKTLYNKRPQTRPNRWPVVRTRWVRVRVLRWSVVSLCVCECVCSVFVRITDCNSQITGTLQIEIFQDELWTISGFGVMFNKWVKVRVNSWVRNIGL